MCAARGITVIGQAAGETLNCAGTPVYEGPVADLPEEHASRRERFAELDQLQAGWVVQLRSRGDAGTMDAHFISPAGAPGLMIGC